MKRLLIALPLFLGANEDFISHYEYGEMLYNSPRGVSCTQCHGKDGAGKEIVSFKDKEGKQIIQGSDIRNTSYKDVLQSVNTYHMIMPRYYLTDKEVKAIYDYLQKNR
ncbi:MAG: cytochrome c [Campylobacterota bacterium]|nr:cytochrome c [Campylobacterota bacterium]